MKKQIIYIYTFSICSLIILSSWRINKDTIDPCMKLIKDSYKAMYPDTNIVKRSVFIDFTIVTNYSLNNKKNVNRTENAKVYSNGYKSYYFSDLMDVYQDKNTSVAVFRDKKEIIINYHVIGDNKRALLPQILTLQDKLFENVSVTKCVDIKGEKNKIVMKNIRLSPNQNLKNKLNVNFVEYTYDINSRMIKEMVVNYPKDNMVNSLKIIYHKINMDDKSNTTKKSPINMVYDNKGKLLPLYKNYQVKDYRK